MASTATATIELGLYLGQCDALDKAVVEIDRRVEVSVARMDQEEKAGQAPFRSLIDLLCTIPFGRDMSRFPTAGHLLAWAGLCPGQNESAGKRKSSRLRKGALWLKTLLVQCAWAADKRKPEAKVKRLVAQIAKLGFEATLKPLPKAA